MTARVTPQGDRRPLPPLSLYIHVPWCLKKCPYCDFNSHEVGASLPEVDYLQSFDTDLARDRPWAHGRELVSIYIGGGTPSLLSHTTLAAILERCAAGLTLSDDIEITLEWNPGSMSATASRRKMRDLRRAGISRLSIGVQSFDDAFLAAVGRIHTARDALAAIDNALEAGFTDINVDLMYGLPAQSVSAALADLTTAVESASTHLSWYQLTVEPNTVFHRSPPSLPDEATLLTMENEGLDLLAAAFERYEISAYARRAGHRSRHNTNYWEFGDYLGLGPGAHGKLTRPDDWRVFRTHKTRHPAHYLEEPKSVRTAVGDRDLPLEFMLNALRLTEGVERRLFSLRTGLSDDTIDDFVDRARRSGLLAPDPARLQPTESGLRYLNDLLLMVSV